MKTPATMSPAEARATVLSAQGFGRGRPHNEIDAAEISEIVRRLGVLQLDSVNVFCRSHYMPVFSRLGAYDRELLDGLAGHTEPDGGREFFEYWGHEASIMPSSVYGLLRWRNVRADLEAWKFVVDFAREHPDYVEQTLALVKEQGPIRASATGAVRDQAHEGEMWNWHEGKLALEYLFYAGRVAVARRVNFERLYDLPQRVLPADALDQNQPEAEAQRQLIRIAASALGVATEPDLGDYFRLTRGDSKARVAELVDAGELTPIRIDGWDTVAYLSPDADTPGQIQGRALLSPFDSLIWTRARAQRVFDFDYHLEIYTPAAKRQYGYYVLPFLVNDQLVGRVDLKTDRKAHRLLVQGVFFEARSDHELVALELAHELTDVAQWLGLDGVDVLAKSDPADIVKRALS
jgi:uncharacterized protein YcaQ